MKNAKGPKLSLKAFSFHRLIGDLVGHLGLEQWPIAVLESLPYAYRTMSNAARSIAVTPEQEAAIEQAVSRGERLRLIGHDGRVLGIVLAEEERDELSADEEASLAARVTDALAKNAGENEWSSLDDLRKLAD